MKDKNLENSLKEILDSLVLSVENETKKQYNDTIEGIINCGYKIENPETFNILINFQIKQVLKQVVNGLNPELEKENLWKLQFLYLNYGFIERHVREVIIIKEGSTCCADKSRWVLERYFQSIVDDNVEDDREGLYYHPQFGSLEDWLEFCEGICSLYQGTLYNYLTAYDKLLSSSSAINFKEEAPRKMNRKVIVKVDGYGNEPAQEFEVLTQEDLTNTLSNVDQDQIAEELLKFADKYDGTGWAYAYLDARTGEVDFNWLEQNTILHPWDSFYEIVLMDKKTPIDWDYVDEDWLKDEEIESFLKWKEDTGECAETFILEKFGEGEFQKRKELIFAGWIENMLFKAVNDEINALYSKVIE